MSTAELFRAARLRQVQGPTRVSSSSGACAVKRQTQQPEPHAPAGLVECLAYGTACTHGPYGCTACILPILHPLLPTTLSAASCPFFTARSSVFYLLAAQDVLQVDLFKEKEDREAGSALVLVQVGQHT